MDLGVFFILYCMSGRKPKPPTPPAPPAPKVNPLKKTGEVKPKGGRGGKPRGGRGAQKRNPRKAGENGPARASRRRRRSPSVSSRKSSASSKGKKTVPVTHRKNSVASKGSKGSKGSKRASPKKSLWGRLTGYVTKTKPKSPSPTQKRKSSSPTTSKGNKARKPGRKVVSHHVTLGKDQSGLTKTGINLANLNVLSTAEHSEITVGNQAGLGRTRARTPQKPDKRGKLSVAPLKKREGVDLANLNVLSTAEHSEITVGNQAGLGRTRARTPPKSDKKRGTFSVAPLKQREGVDRKAWMEHDIVQLKEDVVSTKKGQGKNDATRKGGR